MNLFFFGQGRQIGLLINVYCCQRLQGTRHHFGRLGRRIQLLIFTMDKPGFGLSITFKEP